MVSIFGAMFAPKPFDVAKEMVRVTRPGGRIVMGNWIPNDPTLVAQILKSAPPIRRRRRKVHQPNDLGNGGQRHRAIRGAGVPEEKISFQRDTYTFNFPSLLAAFGLLRPDHERIRLPRRRPGGRAAGGARSPVQQPERQLEQGHHLHSGNIPARHSCALTLTAALA